MQAFLKGGRCSSNTARQHREILGDRNRVKNVVLWRKLSQSPGTDHVLKFCIELDRTGCPYETGLALAQKEQTYAR
jgi:hypothetical protein